MAAGRALWQGRVALWVSALLAGAGLSAFASIKVQTLSPPRVVFPGDVAVHVFSVANLTGSLVQVGLSAQVPQGWSHLGVPASLTLAAGEEELVFLAVLVPRGARAGPHRVRLLTHWNGQEARAEAEVKVHEVIGAELLPPPSGEAEPGQSVRYRLTLINQGNLLDRFTLEASSAHGWSVRVEPHEVTLGPWEEAQISVVVGIPPGARPGREPLTVVARSAAGAERRTAWFTVVLPPGPAAIVGTHLGELAMRFGGELGFDVLTEGKSSSLTLSGKGSALGGNLSLSMVWAGPWDPAPFRLRGISFVYEQGPTRVEAGDVGTELTPLLLSLGAQGFLARADVLGARLLLLSGWRGEEGRAGARGVLSGDLGELGLAYREVRGTGHTRAVTAWITGRMEEGISLRGEGGLSVTGALLDVGFLGIFTAEAGTDWGLRAEAYAVGARFPSTKADRAGFTLSGRLSASPLALRFLSRWERDNVAQVPFLPTLARSELSTAFQWTLKGWPVALFAGARIERIQAAGPTPSVDLRLRTLEASLTAGEANLTLHLSGRWRLEEDLVTDTANWVTAYTQRLSFTISDLKVTLTLTQEATLDEAWNMLSGTNATSLGVRIPGGLSLDWRQSPEGGAVGLELERPLTAAFSVSARVRARWDEGGQATSLGLSLGFAHTFGWAPPFLPVKGWIEGRLFVDLNGNGRYDPGEPGVPGAVLTANDTRVSTGSDGRFLFPPLDPGTYTLAVERLPRGFRTLAALPLRVEVVLAGRTQIAIPCERLGEILGLVFDDLDRNGKHDPGELGLPGVLLSLERDEKVLAKAYTDSRGRFTFLDLPEGTYRVRLDTGSLPERYEPTGLERLEVRVALGVETEIAFGAWQRPRPVLVYQLPVAEFTWDPPTPSAGQQVRFDGTLSSDPDGRIVSWSWDFTGDGVPDAQGPVVTWTFPAPSYYRVSLTVTDNDGFQDRLDLSVEVVP